VLVRKNVLMTASSSGLGAAMACEHAARGSSNLALCARRAERLEARKRELFAAHPGIAVEARALDVNDHDRVFQFRRSCRAALGSLDRVIVNAGISRGVQVGTTGFEVNKSILRANLVAALAQCEAAVEILRHQNRGHLVAISSVSPMRGLSRRTACAASKSGLARRPAEGIRASLLRTPSP
jgi:short-subunit dehydrogenase